MRRASFVIGFGASRSEQCVYNPQMHTASRINQSSAPIDDNPHRERCYGCYRPVDICFCDSIPTIHNRTDVLILQHHRERTHAFNTARIVRRSLKLSNLIFGRREKLAQADLPILPGAALLYPGKQSKLLTEISQDQLPPQLVIIDGTWHHAKTMFRDIPQLHALPQYRLAPTTPGQYRIRLEPTATSLSTVEATVAALRYLEPETEGFALLLGAFNRMVEQQLAHPNALCYVRD